MPEEEAKASANGGRAQAHGIEVPCFDRSDVQELHNIRSAPVIFDDQLVSPDAQDFISKVGMLCRVLHNTPGCHSPLGSAECTTWPGFDPTHAEVEAHHFVSDVPVMAGLEKVEGAMVDEKSHVLGVKLFVKKSVIPTTLG